jgi:hypothetical protein
MRGMRVDEASIEGVNLSRSSSPSSPTFLNQLDYGYFLKLSQGKYV